MINELISTHYTDLNQYQIDDGVTTHVYTDPVAYRRFSSAWRALRAYAPNVEFALNDNATIATWIGTPVQPTQAQITTAIANYQAQQDQQAQADANLRTQVISTAQSAVGVALNNLTTDQVRALLECLLWKQSAVNTNGTIKALTTWLL